MIFREFRLHFHFTEFRFTSIENKFQKPSHSIWQYWNLILTKLQSLSGHESLMIEGKKWNEKFIFKDGGPLFCSSGRKRLKKLEGLGRSHWKFTVAVHLRTMEWWNDKVWNLFADLLMYEQKYCTPSMFNIWCRYLHVHS